MKGLICISSIDQYDLDDYLSYKKYFTDVVDSQLDISFEGIAYLSFNGKDIKYISIFRKNGRIATRKDRVKFSNLIKLKRPVSFEELKNKISSNLKRFLIIEQRGGIIRLSPKVSEFVLDFIKKKNHEIIKHIKGIELELRGRRRIYDGPGRDIVVQEKDAVNLSLHIGGFKEEDITYLPNDGEPAPFLKGFENANLREDVMIANDAQVFGGWSKIKQHTVGSVVFAKNGHRLTIINVNRNTVEETLGVDLILYHHTYESYVMIQYKRMTKEGDDQVYRPIDGAYKSEILRMKRAIKFIGNKKSIAIQPRHYRLNPEFFYFKLCPEKNIELLSQGMIKGMYFPLSYWETLIKSNSTNGAKGGKYFSYKNVERHINNTQFINLAQDGWVGSQVRDSKIITRLISDSLSQGKSVILANYRQNK